MRRFSRAISIRIPVEHGLQDRLQVTLDDHLSDSVGDRRDTKRPSSSRISLRDVNTSHGWRKVTTRTHPIPDPIEILTQIPIKILKGLLVYSCRSPVRLHLPIRFPYITFCYTKRLGSIHTDHPLAGCPPDKDLMTTPLRSSPITGPSFLLRASPPLCSASVLGSLRRRPLGFLPSHRNDRFLCSLSKPVPRSRHLHAGRRLDSMQVASNLCSRDRSADPVFDADCIRNDTSSVVHSRSSP